jgi:hypothetical protein
MQYLFEVSATVFANFELDTWLLPRASIFCLCRKANVMLVIQMKMVPVIVDCCYSIPRPQRYFLIYFPSLANNRTSVNFFISQ